MDTTYMHRAIELAEKGRGRTSPNPLVGAVVVKDSRVVGEGFHEVVGGPHAEVNALSCAGKDANDATMYVTLEPCCVYGRTPPCTEAIIKAGIGEVVVGIEDPNPQVSGSGIDELKNKGIKVRSGILTERVASQNEAYIKYITTGYPFVLMKVAMSMDGKIAGDQKEHTIISNQVSRKTVHILRDRYDAIVVGIGTVLSDDPLLTARIEGRKLKNPLRVIVDSSLRIPLESKIVKTAKQVKTLVACSNGEKSRKNRLLARGIEVLDLPGKDGQVDLRALLIELGKREMASVLWEGGSKLNTSALRTGVIDKVLFFIAPLLVGNKNAPGVINDALKESGKIYQLQISNVCMVEGDLMVEAYCTNT